jgi:threonyl-tRNA synthetase
MRRRMAEAGHATVRTPPLRARPLSEKSGHRATFAEHRVTVGDGERRLALKPMNGPGHVRIFN